jgi:hypothetical protein
MRPESVSKVIIVRGFSISSSIVPVGLKDLRFPGITEGVVLLQGLRFDFCIPVAHHLGEDHSHQECWNKKGTGYHPTFVEYRRMGTA